MSRAASLLTGLLNAWALWLAQKPGAGIYFDTAYAAVVCLVLIGLCWLAFHWKLRLRAALPCILLTAVVAVGLGNALSRDVVHIDLVGSANAPAIVVSQNDTAVVLFRGGASTQYAVENQLARRGVHTVELLADLRTKPESACTLEAEQTVSAEKLRINTAQKQKCTPALVEILRTREGAAVRLTIGNRQFVTLSGKVELAQPLSAQWLLASPAKPDAVRYENVLAAVRLDARRRRAVFLPQSAAARRAETALMLCNPGRVWYNNICYKYSTSYSRKGRAVWQRKQNCGSWPTRAVRYIIFIPASGILSGRR